VDLTLKKEDQEKLLDFVDEALEKDRTHFSGQTFEDGIRAVIEVMEGTLTVAEVIE